MKKQPRPAKLTLKSETIRNLDHLALKDVAGAISHLLCASERAGKTCTPGGTDAC